MGFWGTFVVHRGGRLLWELLPDVTALSDAELCFDRVSGNWQVTRVLQRCRVGEGVGSAHAGMAGMVVPRRGHRLSGAAAIPVRRGRYRELDHRQRWEPPDRTDEVHVNPWLRA
jgi:hypothetical protein